ncbi:hypothetical protein QR680_008800 [Steinernema hermaphroditum]|uniref:B30.2/SPRY domain-containing protein n=1 Tax=Steinernema hermaphroditum TaxID=289476 RepID=A0AA39IJG8_9BILA|nr:hypothetical protein QR680_008800 [Steinernema hermaphroditum]
MYDDLSWRPLESTPGERSPSPEDSKTGSILSCLLLGSDSVEFPTWKALFAATFCGAFVLIGFVWTRRRAKALEEERKGEDSEMDDDVPMDEDEFSPVGSGVAFGSGEMISSTSTTDGGPSSLANSMDDSSEEPEAPGAANNFSSMTFEPDETLAQERLERLYPQLDISKHPLPRRWSNHDRFQLLTLSADFLRVGYNGKTHKDAAALRADNPIPRILGIYYFEIHVVHQGINGYVGIGLCEKTVSLNRLPGWDKCSYGYHGDDGNFFSSSGNGIKYGPIFTTNDIIGCGINFMNKEIFFTKNGEYLGKAVDNVNTENDLYPTIGLQTRDVLIDTNFGQKPFRYNIAADIEQLQRATLRQVMNTRLSWKKNEWMNRACASWFLHRGYTRAYEAIAKIHGTELDPADAELMEKQRALRKMMANGQVSKTISALEKDMPEMLATNKELSLMLTTQQFIEMLKKRSRSRSRSKQRGSSVSIANGSSAPASSSSTGKRPASDSAPHPSRNTVKRRTNGVERTWEDPDKPCSSSANGNAASRLKEDIKNGQTTNGKAATPAPEDVEEEQKPMEREVSVDAMTTTVVAEEDYDSEDGITDGVVDGVLNGYSQSDMAPFEKFAEIIEFGRTVHELSQTFQAPQVQLDMMNKAFSLVGRSWSEMKHDDLFDPKQRQDMSEMLNIAILGHSGKRTTSLLTEHLLKAKMLERTAQRNNVGGAAFTNVEDFMMNGFDRTILRDEDDKKLILDQSEPIKFADDMTSRPAGDSSFYAGKTILAPMVRAGRTPLCMLALKNGADLVYTEEIVDQRLIASKRIENEVLGTVDYVIENDIVLRIDPVKEKPRLVLQIGTNDPDRAVEVLKKTQGDIAAIDVNMGCPKPFSISGGMGAALLSQPEKVKQILTSLVAVAEIPVSCKIRVLDGREETLEFAKMIEACGVAALGVHGRRRVERPGDANRNEEIREIAEVLKIPVVANGGSSQLKCFADIEKFRKETGASSVMVARKALSNPSIFREDGMKTMQGEIEDFLDFVCEYDENFTATKYVVQRILGGEQEFDPRGRQTVLAATVHEICKAWNREEKFVECKKARLRHSHKRHLKPDPETGICFFDISFPPKRLRMNAGAGSPKCVLNKYCDEAEIERPKYHLIHRKSDGRYEAVAELCGKKFSSRIPQPNKKMAEQVAALVALVGLEQRERLAGEWED